MNKIKLYILFLFVSNNGFSQQTITNNQYYLFDYFYNPSLSGGESNNPLYINYIDQWAGFENSPTKITAGFEFSTPYNDGFSILFTQNNQGGSFKEDQLNFNYSKQFVFNKKNKLSLGLGILASQKTSDFSNVNTAIPNDNIFSTSSNEVILDGSFGVNYTSKNFEIGVSALYLNNSNLEISKNQLTKSFRNGRQYYLISSYSFQINEKVSLTPNILFNFLTRDFFLRSFALLANFNETFTFGLANRNYSTNLEASENHPNYRNLTLAFILGYEFKKFCTYYNYEISKNISFPTHELTVGYKFEKRNKNRFTEIDIQHPLQEEKINFIYQKTKLDNVLVKEEKVLEASELDSINSKNSLDLIPNVTSDDLLLSSEKERENSIFKFEKLTADQLNMVNLIIVDADGNILFTALKTEDGFTFSKIPDSGEYFYKLENMPDGTAFDFMEINIVEAGVSKKVVASLIKDEKVLEVSETHDEEATVEDSSIIKIKNPNSTINDSNFFEQYFKKVNVNIYQSDKYKSDKNVEFSFDNYSITRGYKVFLDSLKEFIEQHENISVIIEGHTDNVGSEQYNMALSQRRATSVLNYLTEQGIDKKILTAEGLGEVKPIASNANPAGRALNRRTEIYIIYLNKKE
jgi:type IX secretion system PorP/SprF family membrane protein